MSANSSPILLEIKEEINEEYKVISYKISAPRFCANIFSLLKNKNRFKFMKHAAQMNTL